jgi:bacterioferritin-associated ferredoxin
MRQRASIDEGMKSLKTLVVQVNSLMQRLANVPDQITDLQSHVKVLFECAEAQRQAKAVLDDSSLSMPDWTKLTRTSSPLKVAEAVLTTAETTGSGSVSVGSEGRDIPSSTNTTQTTTADRSTRDDKLDDRDAEGSDDEEWNTPTVPEGEITSDNLNQDDPMETGE